MVTVEPPAPSSVPIARREVLLRVRTVLTVLALGALFFASVQVLALLGTVLRLLLVATFLAVVLNPMVGALERRGLGRGSSTLIVFLGLLLALAAFFGAILTPLYNELTSFVDNADEYVADLRNSSLLQNLDARYDVLKRAQEEAKNLPARLPSTAPALLGIAGTVFTVLFETVTVLFLTAFLLLELPAVTRSIEGLLLPGPRRVVRELGQEINRTVVGYVAGNLIISVIAGLTVAISLAVLGVPYAWVLGLLMGVADLLPLVGATAGGAVVILVAFTQGVIPGVATIVVIVVYQQVENHLLQPIVMNRTVAVSPFIVIVSVLVGATLLGVLGALLAIPAAGSVQIILRYALTARRRRVEAAERALAEGATS